MAYIVMADMVIAYIVMTYIVMAYIVLAYRAMAYIFMAYTFTFSIRLPSCCSCPCFFCFPSEERSRLPPVLSTM